MIRGDRGNDRISGGRGRDILSGGLDQDVFVFKSVKDLGDRIHLRQITGVKTFADLNFFQRGDTTIISDSTGRTIVHLDDVEAKDLSAIHFRF